jgi:hypothetical protein
VCTQINLYGYRERVVYSVTHHAVGPLPHEPQESDRPVKGATIQWPCVRCRRVAEVCVSVKRVLINIQKRPNT